MPDKPEAARLTVIGEALVDLVPGASVGCYQAKPGGSPFNVAIGLARLGHHTTLMARLADTAFGRLLREHASAEGIDLGPAVHAAEPTTLAVVGLDSAAQASYDFYLQGTADWQWTDDERACLPGLAEQGGADVGIVADHYLAVAVQPRRRGEDALVSRGSPGRE